MSEIYGVNTILEKSVVIDDVKIKEMRLIHFLKYLNKEYDLENLENIENIIELVFECSGKRIELADETIEGLLLYFNAILQMIMGDNENKEKEYEYTIDYSYFVAKVMKWYSYNLQDVYRLPYSVFNTLLNHITVLEAEEDQRMSRVVDNQLNLKSESTKNNYTSFKDMLNEKIKSVINCTITEKANIKKWRQFNGLSDLKKEINKEV